MYCSCNFIINIIFLSLLSQLQFYSLSVSNYAFLMSCLLRLISKNRLIKINFDQVAGRMALTYTKDKFILRYYESVSKSFRSGRLERELQLVQLSATWCNCITIL